MKQVFLAGVLTLCALSAPPALAQSDDPFARSRDGAIECYTPDPVRHTCRALAAYRFEADGRIVNDAIVYLDQGIVMYISSVVYARDGMNCGEVKLSDLDAARFHVNGVRASPEQAQAIRAAVAQSLAGMREICSRFTPDGEGAVVTTFVDGVERPDFADRMIWIRPEDGYTPGAAAGSPA